MKRGIALFLVVIMIFSLAACSSEESNQNPLVDVYKTKATEFIESGDTESAKKALEEGVAATGDKGLEEMLYQLKKEAEKQFDIADYIGEWQEKENVHIKGGMYLNISHSSDKYIDVLIEVTKKNSIQIASAEFTVLRDSIKDNKLESPFKDSFGNEGYITIEFFDGKIVCEVTDVEMSKSNSFWGVNEGKYTLTIFEKMGGFDKIIGTYMAVDEYDTFLYIDYANADKEKPRVIFEMPNGRYGLSYEVTLSFKNGSYSGHLMSGGSEPSFSISINTTDSGWLEAEVLIADNDIDFCENMIFAPVDDSE